MFIIKNVLKHMSYGLFSLSAFIFFSFPRISFACDSLMNHGLFCSDDTGPEALGRAVTALSPIMYTLAVVMMTFGGVIMFTSIGNATKYDQGKKMIMAGLIGAALFSGFWLILSLLGINFT